MVALCESDRIGWSVNVGAFDKVDGKSVKHFQYFDGNSFGFTLDFVNNTFPEEG